MVMFALASNQTQQCFCVAIQRSSPSPPMPARDNDHQLASNINELVLIAPSPAGQAMPDRPGRRNARTNSVYVRPNA